MTVKSGGRLADAEELERIVRVREGRTLPLRTPIGLLGAYLGYDAIVEHADGVLLVLNRTVLRVQQESLEP